MKKIGLLCILTSTMLLSGCSNFTLISNSSSSSNTTSSSNSTTTSSSGSSSSSTSTSGSTTTVPAGESGSYTILIYMCGSDLESGSDGGYATSDLNEIAAVSNQPSNVNIAIEAGGAKSWKSTYSSVVSGTNLSRFHLENKTFVKGEKDIAPTKASMGKTSTFQSVLEWGLTQYPAEKTGVIMWNHGGGMYGVCYDENYSDDSLLNSEVNAALAGAFASTGRTTKLEWIGYDACLMEVQDIAEFNSQYFNYMVAAQESESGTGWDYDAWLPTLFANSSVPSTTLLPKICDTFIAENDTLYAGYGQPNDQTLSVLDLNKASTYKAAWEGVSSQLAIDASTNSLKLSVKTNLLASKRYAVDDESSEDYFCLFDIQDFINKLQANSSLSTKTTLQSKLTSAENALSELIFYNKVGSGAGNSNGLSLFCLSSAYSSFANSIYSTSQTNFTNWRSYASTIAY